MADKNLAGRDLLSKSFSQAFLRPSSRQTQGQTTSLPSLRVIERNVPVVTETVVKQKQTNVKFSKSLLLTQDQTQLHEILSGLEDREFTENLLKDAIDSIASPKDSQVSDSAQVKVRPDSGVSKPRFNPSRTKSIFAQIREKEAVVQKANKSVKSKIMDIEKLAVNDQEMIELQRKTIYVQQLEIEELKRKFKVISRNMTATTNATKTMHDEITLVKEDRVVLELQNQKMTEKVQETEQNLRKEIMGMRLVSGQLQKTIKKMQVEHAKEIKNKNRQIKTIIRNMVTTAHKGCQTDLIDGVTVPLASLTLRVESEEGLTQQLNDIYAGRTVKKARLPLSQVEDELIIASRVLMRKFNKSAQYQGTQDDEPIMRDTIGLKHKETNHVNIGIQVGQKITPHMKNLLEHIRGKNLSLQRKDGIIGDLRKKLEDARIISEQTIADAVSEATAKLQQDHSEMLSSIIKQKDSLQQKVVTGLKEQRDKAQTELAQLKSAIHDIQMNNLLASLTQDGPVIFQSPYQMKSNNMFSQIGLTVPDTIKSSNFSTDNEMGPVLEAVVGAETGAVLEQNRDVKIAFNLDQMSDPIAIRTSNGKTPQVFESYVGLDNCPIQQKSEAVQQQQSDTLYIEQSQEGTAQTLVEAKAKKTPSAATPRIKTAQNRTPNSVSKHSSPNRIHAIVQASYNGSSMSRSVSMKSVQSSPSATQQRVASRHSKNRDQELRQIERDTLAVQKQNRELILANQDLKWTISKMELAKDDQLVESQRKLNEFEGTIMKERQEKAQETTKIQIEVRKYRDLMGNYLRLEKEHREKIEYAETQERELKYQLQTEKCTNMERLFEIENLKSKLQDTIDTKETVTKSQREEIVHLKHAFLDLKRLFQKKLDVEKQTLQDQLLTMSRNIAKLHVHMSCLGCDQIRTDCLMLGCGHNICNSCLSMHSKSDHPRSSVRCEVCKIETKVASLVISLPNRAVCEDLTDVKMRVEHLLNYDIIGETIVKEVFKKTSFDRIQESII